MFDRGDVESRLVVGEHALRGGGQCRFWRRIAGPARIADVDGGEDVAEGIDLKVEFVRDPRIARVALVLEGEGFSRSNVEDGVAIDAGGLERLNGEIMLRDGEGVGGGGRRVFRVDFGAQDLTLEGAI